MDDLADELDLRYHRGVKLDAYYRVPITESLDGALRNKLDGMALSLNPLNIVTEFVFFAAASTVTIPVIQQANLDALIELHDFAQRIQVEYAFTRHYDGKDRLEILRAVWKSIVAAIKVADEFKYSERHACNPKTGSDGARLRNVCQDSLENKDRKANEKKKDDDAEVDDENTKVNPDLTLTNHCGGAIHVTFSIKREAISVMYEHNSIYQNVENRTNDNSNPADPEANGESTTQVAKTPNGTTEKRKRTKKDYHIASDNDFHDPDLDMPTSLEALKFLAKTKRRKDGTISTKPSAKESKTANATTISLPIK